ncbi:regulatory iron-sulfur-containing complex subunit RicT [Pseudoflavonifractor sp.]|jgi:cell fate regulator YaaT (PSP1 superfamily)|uniref:PSP1 domain-containing protein n=1 Tax=Pseudoflavonifractor sp. TaxID=1980281 RepID=UPI003D8CE3E9
MTEIISVRFKSGGKEYYFDPRGTQVRAGQGVIIETSRGIEYGECVKGNTMVEDESVVAPLRPLVRIATEKDLDTVARNREKEKKAFHICQEKIAAHGLDMKLVEVEYNFEGNKILFFFTSEGRVDFRALVKDLAGIFHTRIELRQIGVRDEAKMLGGLGICGRPFCCASFLDDFQPVSIKMAKTQSLSLNPTKISGTCGRLMCCLKYEQDAYEDAVKRMPKNESFVETPEGVGTVSQVNLLRETVKVRLDDAPESPRCFHNCEICVVRNGKGKRPEGYVAPPSEELAKLRKVTPLPEDPEEKLRSSLGTALTGLGLTASVRTEGEQQQAEAKSGRSRSRSRNRGGEKAEQAPRQAQEGKPQKKQENKPRPEQKKAEPKAQQEGKPRQEQKKQEKRGDKPQQKPKGDKPRQERPPQQAQQQPKVKPEAVNAEGAAEGGEKKSTRHRHRRHRPRAKGEGGAAPTAPQE